MKKSSVARSFFSLLLGSVLFANPAQATPKPDLVITAFGLKSWGVCAPGKPVCTFSVTVKNQGTASWPASAKPFISVKDLHPGEPGWGTGVGIAPPLMPGKIKTILVPVFYMSNNPKHMTDNAPHPFQVVVNSNHIVNESDFTNNAGPGPATWNGIKVIMVGAPQGCPPVN